MIRVGVRFNRLVALTAFYAGLAAAQDDAATQAEAPLRLEVSPRICEAEHECHLDFTIRPQHDGARLCLLMDDGERQTLTCEPHAQTWHYATVRELDTSTRFLLWDQDTGAILGEVLVDLARFVPHVRPRRRHGWFSL